MNKLKNLKTNFICAVGLDMFCPDFVTYLKSHIYFLIYNNIHSIFVNTLFKIATGENKSVMIYNLVMYAVFGVTMLAASYVSRRLSALKCMRMSMLFYSLMYAVFFLTLGNLQSSMLFIAVIHGLAGSFYWFTYSMSLGFYTDDDNRDKAIGVISLFSAIVQFVVPLIAGAVIGACEGMTGYIIMFAFALVIAVMNFFVAGKINEVKLPDTSSHIRKAFKITFTQKPFFFIMMSQVIRGFRDGTFSFFLNILLFGIVANEFIIAVNTVLTAVIAILGSMAYGRIINGRNRSKATMISTCIMVASACLLFFGLNAVSIIVFACINTFFQIFLLNTNFSVYFKLVQSSPEAMPLSCEMHAIKEVYLSSIGRTAGILLVILMPQSDFGSVLAIVFLTLSQFLLVYFQRCALKELKLQEVEA